MIDRAPGAIVRHHKAFLPPWEMPEWGPDAHPPLEWLSSSSRPPSRDPSPSISSGDIDHTHLASRDAVWVPARRPGRRNMSRRSRDMVLSELCNLHSALRSKRAQGRPGARCTRGLVCNVHHKKCAHEHTGSAETLRPSLRNGFTAYIVLSLVNRSLLPPSPPRGVSLSRT